MKRLSALFTLLAALPHAFAHDANPRDSETEQLLALLAEQTAIATKTRMNADYVPGMVTVLNGSDLEARGVRTVWEALALVPGVELAMESTGRRKILIRGLGNIWGSGNVKILLDDVSLNSAERGLADPVLNMLISQVERIEVVRGPGSAIHGEFAYLGVINVVTRRDSERLFGFGGNFATRGGGATLSFASPDEESHLSLNLAGWRSSGADVPTATDGLHAMGLEAASNTPGKANQEMEEFTAVAHFDYQRFSMVAEWSEDAMGDHFGINDFLPPDPNRLVEWNRHRAVEARQGMPLTQGLQAQLHAGWQEMQVTRDGYFVGPAEYFSAEGADIFLESLYRERKLYGGVDLTWEVNERHNGLLGFQTSDIRVDDGWTGVNLTCTPDFSTCTPTNSPVLMDIGVPRGTHRSIQSAILQDEFRWDDSFTITAGARYDDYNDIGSRLSPRVAGVWRITNHHIVKAQCAEAFRPPTLYELSQPAVGNLKPALINTCEAGYVYQGGPSITRLTAFRSRLDDLLVAMILPAPKGFANRRAHAWGWEWEQRQRLDPHTTLDATLSYVDTKDENTGRKFPGSVTWIANTAVLREQGDMHWALQGHYVSDYHREADDPRPDLRGYTTFDFTASFLNVSSRGVTLRLGVKNLFDTELRFPSLRNDLGYADDYPQAGRTGWLEVSYDR